MFPHLRGRPSKEMDVERVLSGLKHPRKPMYLQLQLWIEVKQQQLQQDLYQHHHHASSWSSSCIIMIIIIMIIIIMHHASSSSPSSSSSPEAAAVTVAVPPTTTTTTSNQTWDDGYRNRNHIIGYYTYSMYYSDSDGSREKYPNATSNRISWPTIQLYTQSKITPTTTY